MGLSTLQLVIPILPALRVIAKPNRAFLCSIPPPSSASKALFNKQEGSSLSGWLCPGLQEPPDRSNSCLCCQDHIFLRSCALDALAQTVGEARNEKPMDFFFISFCCREDIHIDNMMFGILATFEGLAPWLQAYPLCGWATITTHLQNSLFGNAEILCSLAIALPIFLLLVTDSPPFPLSGSDYSKYFRWMASCRVVFYDSLFQLVNRGLFML